MLAAAVAPAGAHRCRVGCVAQHGILEFFQPRPDRQPEFGQPVFPHVDVDFFLDREAEAGGAVVEKRRAHA